jgi:hypothetical protein
VVCSSRAGKTAARLATLVAAGLLLTGTTAAQPISDTRIGSKTTGERLNLVVLQGLDAVSDVHAPTTTMVVVEVRDENYRPLEGATVEFELPPTGPSGSFEGGGRIKKAITNAQGQAFTAFEPNPAAGRFSIQARATFGARTGMVTINRPTQPAQSRMWINRHKTLVIVIAVGVAGAATAAILTTRGGASSSSSKPTVTITSGIPSFGSPQ